MKLHTLGLVCVPLFLLACGHAGSDDSSLTEEKKKLVVLCEGAVFNDADPFGKRVALSAQGTRTYKVGEFSVGKTKDYEELKKVATALRQQCYGGALVVNISICDQIDIVNTDTSFHRLEHNVNGFSFKGSYICSLAEKK